MRSSTNRSASRLKGTGRRGRPPSGWRTAWPSGESASAASRRASGFWADILQRMVRTRAAVVGGVLVGSFLVVVLLAPVVAPYDPLKGRLGERQPASGAHWLGTDETWPGCALANPPRSSDHGPDPARSRGPGARPLHGARPDGGLRGAVGGPAHYALHGHLDGFPGIFLALAIIAALGTGQGNLVMATGIFLVPQFARVVHASILTLKDLQFVQAARAGARGRRARVSLPGSQLFGADHRPDQPPNGDGAPHGVRSLVPRAGRAADHPRNGGRCSPTLART